MCCWSLCDCGLALTNAGLQGPRWDVKGPRWVLSPQALVEQSISGKVPSMISIKTIRRPFKRSGSICRSSHISKNYSPVISRGAHTKDPPFTSGSRQWKWCLPASYRPHGREVKWHFKRMWAMELWQLFVLFFVFSKLSEQQSPWTHNGTR